MAQRLAVSALNLHEVFSLRALWAAAQRASRGKRYDRSVARWRLDAESRVVALRDALVCGRWTPSPASTVLIRDPKPRRIAVPTFGDRVVHHALVAAIEPRVSRRLIADCYACRPGLGTHPALRRARAWARTWRYAVHLDVSQYFASVDHELLRAQLRQDLPEDELRALCERILRAGGTAGSAYFPGDDLFTPRARRVGLPLGALTSQLWANRYLDPVDHLVKDRLRLRGYLRYMDDMLLFHDDRATLVALARALEDACLALRLRLHPWEALPTRGGVNFVGYGLRHDHTRVRASSVARATRRLRWRMAQGEDLRSERFREGLRSVFAHWAHADSWRLREKLLRRLGLHLDDDP